MSEASPPPKPEHLERNVEDSIPSIEESVEARVGQAQVQIATAIGQAHDASVRIEEFGAGATTAAQRELAAQLAADNAAVRDRLTDINDTLEAIRADAAASVKSTARYNRASTVFGAVGCLTGIIGAVVGVLGLLVLFGVIGR